MIGCQTCGASLPTGARFCPACGAEIAPDAATGSRRPVTVVFTDVVGSTALGERLDAETLGGLMTRYYETMRAVIERHGGAVEKFIGDAVVATFGAPEVHEDDAMRAVRAAAQMHASLEELNDELERRWGTRLEVRTGVATGEVLAGGGAAVLGSPANLAARLQSEAGDGEILLAGTTERLVRAGVRTEPAGDLELKGFAGPIACARLLSIDDAPRAHARAPLVGRQHELELLLLAFRRTARDRRAQLVTVLGEPGIGKTRLVDEAVAAIGDEALVARGRCLPYGEGITFFPVAEAIAQAVGIGRDDGAERAKAKVAAAVPSDASGVAARVSEAIGFGGPAGEPDETLWAIRRYLQLLAAERPIVLVFDDLQWAEPTFLDLVASLVERGAGVAELVVAIARPELVEQRPGWSGGTANALTVSLEPLRVEEGAELVRHVAGGGTFEDATAAALAAAAGGNPLFLEEYVAMLVDDGTLVERDGRWLVPPDLGGATAPPPTLLGLLTARLHRLPAAERDALMRASVVGKVFTIEELRALSSGGPEPDGQLDAVVGALLERDLLREGAGEAGTVEFQHQLLRDAAYASLPKSRRAELHERFAGRLDHLAGDRPEELDELTGFHLGRAHDYRLELGSSDDATRDLGDRAAARLSAAGERAVERGDLAAGTRLLERAIGSTSDPAARARMRLPHCQALGDAADPSRFTTAIDAALGDAADAGDERLQLRFEQMRLTSSLFYEPQAMPPHEMSQRLVEIADALERLGDDEGVSDCHYHVASAAWFTGDMVGFERGARRSLHHAIASGSPRSIGRAADYLVNAWIRGPKPLPDALVELEEVRGGTAFGIGVAAELRASEATIVASLGRPDEARALLSSAAADLVELGVPRVLASIEAASGTVEDMAGDLEASEAAARRSHDWFLANGDVGNGGLVAGQLADVLARLGRADEAMRLAEDADAIAPTFDLEAQAGWRMGGARAQALLGRHDDAIETIGAALRLVEPTDLVLLRADLLRTAADVSAIAGRADEAGAAWREALEVYDRKGHVVGARRVRDALAGAQSS